MPRHCFCFLSCFAKLSLFPQAKDRENAEHKELFDVETIFQNKLSEFAIEPTSWNILRRANDSFQSSKYSRCLLMLLSLSRWYGCMFFLFSQNLGSCLRWIRQFLGMWSIVRRLVLDEGEAVGIVGAPPKPPNPPKPPSPTKPPSSLPNSLPYLLRLQGGTLQNCVCTKCLSKELAFSFLFEIYPCKTRG